MKMEDCDKIKFKRFLHMSISSFVMECIKKYHEEFGENWERFQYLIDTSKLFIEVVKEIPSLYEEGFKKAMKEEL